MSTARMLEVIAYKLDLVLQLQDSLLSKVDALMAVSQDIQALCAKIDAATTAVGSRLAALSGQITNGMSDQEVADVKAHLQAEIDTLTAMGKDPANPTPPPVQPAP